MSLVCVFPHIRNLRIGGMDPPAGGTWTDQTWSGPAWSGRNSRLGVEVDPRARGTWIDLARPG